MRWALLAVVACAFLVWEPGAAHADEDLVGILSIDATGVSGAAAEQFETEVEQALTGLGRHSVSRKALRERLQGSEYLEGCYFGPCLTALRVASGVPLVLVARIQGEGSSYSFVITLVDTKTGLLTAQVAQTCPVCTVDEAIMTATLATITLLSGGDEAVVSPGDTGDSGASLVSGSTTPTKPAKSNKALRTTGWIFLGVGMAAAAAGAYLFEMEDERDLGIAGAAAGTGLLTGGVTMLLF